MPHKMLWMPFYSSPDSIFFSLPFLLFLKDQNSFLEFFNSCFDDVLIAQNFCSFLNADEVPVEWQCN